MLAGLADDHLRRGDRQAVGFAGHEGVEAGEAAPRGSGRRIGLRRSGRRAAPPRPLAGRDCDVLRRAVAGDRLHGIVVRLRSLQSRDEIPAPGICPAPRRTRPRCAGGSWRESIRGRTGSACRSAARCRRSPAACPRRTTTRIGLVRPCRPARPARPTRSPYRPWSLPLLPRRPFPSARRKVTRSAGCFCHLRSSDSSDASTAVKPLARRRRQEFSPSHWPARNRRQIPTNHRARRLKNPRRRCDPERGKPVGTKRADCCRGAVSWFTD